MANDFIITRNGEYFGLGKVRDLLRKITELQIRNARYSNPLTQLPGNVPIYEFIDSLLFARKPFQVAYCDLNNFKPYNDVYGYAKGDAVLQKLASILSAHVSFSDNFLGHIGGDDFIIVFQDNDWRKKLNTILTIFECEAPLFYDEKDRRSGGIWAHDRTGQPKFYSFLSLSIGVVMPDCLHCGSHHEVASLATEAKHEAKNVGGNNIFISRRKRPSDQPGNSVSGLPKIG
jgi:GGDEF domain-containing protein